MRKGTLTRTLTYSAYGTSSFRVKSSKNRPSDAVAPTFVAAIRLGGLSKTTRVSAMILSPNLSYMTLKAV